MDEPPTYVIVGRGRVGRSLVDALERLGASVRLVAGTDGDDLAVTASAPPLVLLAVPDSAIAEVGARVVRTTRELAGVVHLSGGTTLQELERVRSAGTPVGSFHPFTPFATVRGADAFVGIVVGIDASHADLRHHLHALAKAFGAKPLQVRPEVRVMYHVAATVASAQVVALASQAQELLRQCGWSADDSLEALLPLMRATVENLRRSGLPEALSGPVRRGDAATIGKHLEALRGMGAVEASYRSLTETGLAMSMQLGLDEERARHLRSALEQM